MPDNYHTPQVDASATAAYPHPRTSSTVEPSTAYPYQLQQDDIRKDADKNFIVGNNVNKRGNQKVGNIKIGNCNFSTTSNVPFKWSS